MIKKTLIISLAICLFAVNVFAGTSMLTLVQDVSAASAPAATVTETVAPKAIHVIGNNTPSASTEQTLTYYDCGALTPETNVNTNAATDAKSGRWGWVLVELPLTGFESISDASLSASLRWNGGANRFYVNSLAGDVWNSAVTGLVGNQKTLSEEKFLGAPTTTGYLCQSDSGTNVGTGSYKTTVLESDGLTTYLNGCTSAKKAYLVIFGYHTGTKDGGTIDLSTLEFTVTGKKAVEGLYAGIVASKTVTLPFGAGDIGIVKTDDATTDDVDESTINNYSNATDKCQMTTSNDKQTDSTVLYLKKDISAYKNIEKVELVVESRANSTANTLEISRSADWIADGEGEISLKNQPAVDGTVDAFTLKGFSDVATRRFDITSLAKNLPDGNNGVLSLRVRGILGWNKTGYAVQFNQLDKTNGTQPRLEITYKDEIAGDETTGTSFTYTTQVEEGHSVRLLVAVYDGSGNFLGAIINNQAVVSDGETPIEMEVNLSAYPTAASVRAFMWNGITLMPYVLPIERDVA